MEFKPFNLRDDLLLGVATAATQIEGGDRNNDWYAWTKDGKVTKDGTSTLRANNHYINYKNDIFLMKEFGFQIYRLSIEWSRIEPEQGKFNIDAMAHYIDEIKTLMANGIKPLITLHHFSNPIWFSNLGGWEKKKNIQYFLEYVKFVVEHLRNVCHQYCTINEPNVYAVNCYFYGEWLVQKKKLSLAIKVLKNLAKAHIFSYKLIHELDKEASVGFAMNILNFVAKKQKNPLQRFEAKIYNQCYNDSIVKAMGWGKFSFPLGCFGRKKGTYLDFFGINYYTQNDVSGWKNMPNKDLAKNDLGWAIFPLGLRHACEKYHSFFNLPIFISENGTCDKTDSFRPKFIYDHLLAINDLDYVKRYYHWTFMDNFEWKEGESACFGLFAYDYEKGVATPRKSAYFFRDIIANRAVTQKMIKDYLQ